MKRLVIVGGIAAFVSFVLYQLMFAENRSRLKVDLSKGSNMSIEEPVAMLMNNAATERKFMKEAVVNFQVGDVIAAKNAINALIKTSNAYVGSHNEEDRYGGPWYQTVVHVPSDRLDDFVSKLEPLAKKMKSKNLSAQDVTGEYIDLSARLVTKRALESNYRRSLGKPPRSVRCSRSSSNWKLFAVTLNRWSLE